jgi:hypothetical protein
VTFLLVLGFAAPGGGWWFVLAALWSIVGIRRAVVEVPRQAPGELGPAEGEWEDLAFEAAPGRGLREDGRSSWGAKAFAAAGAGSLVVLGVLLAGAFEPVSASFGPVRIVVYSGLVVLAAVTGILSVAFSAAGATDVGLPSVRAALRLCAGLGCALLAGLALLVGDSLFGRPEGILAALTGAAGLIVLLRSGRLGH